MDDHQPGKLGRLALKVMSEHSLIYKLFFGPDPYRVRWKVIMLFLTLLIINVVVWVVAVIVYKPYPAMLGTAAIAYVFGLRHAVDADHISAIDNVTRKLLNENQRPVCVGLFFSLGHSTVVFIAAIVLAAIGGAVKDFEQFQKYGGIVGTSISIAFLTLIAILNTIVLVGVVKTLRRVKREGVYTEMDIEEFLSNRGLLGRFFRPLFRFIDASWKMYPLGFCFSIGFDTSTQIIVLGITATQAAQGMSMWLVIILPLLFASGMALIDSLDSLLMLFTYTWAYVNPVRKLYYNLTITSISVVVAVIVALIEFFSLIADELELENGWWEFWQTLADNFEWIGVAIIGAFIVTWVATAAIYRLFGYHHLEKQFDAQNPDEKLRIKQNGMIILKPGAPNDKFAHDEEAAAQKLEINQSHSAPMTEKVEADAHKA
ncbi:high-affinity nickel-transport protein-domain-containing protein [Radiomyces spectabilis]|uniref:high-affinity nickel-transport protein-domain-containing protein n=1 Tax=Radiomyces spectabilis TaxID=64574 RepID=UPI00221F0C36|nr:high-affinity nickel-transport protein-domain-containing protein [Radiomyces spectabilis]KAI8373010.1 high-affinity nickel-transport protein-domain-containing protein [Radiomyces spectabilis]